MKFSILENSMDSLNEAIDYYKNGKEYNDERCFKFCVLLLSHCAELMLKEILFQQHEVLIYEDIDKVGEKTIGFRLALKRVNTICKIDLGRYSTYLSDLVNLRNIIQHYEFTVSSEQCTKTITASFSAIEYIVYHILNKTFNDFEDVITKEQIDYLHEDTDIYIKRKQDVANDISKHNLKKVGIEYAKSKFIYTPCPTCSEETLILEEGGIKCKFCGKKYASLEEVKDDDFYCVISAHMLRWIGRRKAIFQNIYECQICNYDTLIYSEVSDEWICLVCRNKTSCSTCSDCGDRIPDSEYNYTFAQSYTDTEDYKYLCKECGKKLEDSEYSCEYDIR